MLTKQERSLAQGTRVESRRVREPTEQLCLMACSLGFYGDGISFQVVLSQSFWLGVLPGGAALPSQDGCQREGFWEVVGHPVSPFDLSWTLPVGGGLLVLCSLPGPPVVKQLMQMVTVVSGQGGRFQSVCFPWHYYGVFLPGFLEPIILICLVHSPYLGFLRILPHVFTHLLAEMGPTAEATGWSIRLHSFPSRPARSLFCSCVVAAEGGGEVLLTLGMRAVEVDHLPQLRWLASTRSQLPAGEGSEPNLWLLSREWRNLAFVLSSEFCLMKWML